MRSNLPDESPAPSDILAELARIQPRLGPLARPLHYFDSVESTNDVAAKLAAAGTREGTTIIADSQSAGRGRLGRRWASPPGAGLYVSIVFRPLKQAWTAGLESAALLTLATGVAVAEAIRSTTGLPAEIKWPNDVLIGRRKLAGILAEAGGAGSSLQYVVVGIGVNLRLAAFPRDLEDRVTSIEMELGRAADRGLVLAEILAALWQRYDQLRSADFDAILTSWQALSPSARGARVEWAAGDGWVRGVTAGIDARGALIVQRADRTERLIAGEVRWL